MYLKMLIGLAFTLLTFSLTAQPVDSATRIARQKRYDYYWEKHKNRATTGWILLGTGLAASVGGLFLIGDGASDYPSVDLPLPLSIAIGAYGIGATLTSVPFFIWAGDNKRKARMALKGETVHFGDKTGQQLHYTAATLVIPLP